MILTPAQEQIARDKHRFRVLNCGRRFGKTTEAIEEIKGKALYVANKGDKICYIAPTYQQARDIAWEMLKEEFSRVARKINESRLEIEVPNKKGEPVLILLRGWESIETLRGQKFVFIVIDEVASMRNFWVGWNEVLSPTLLDRKGDVLFISTPKGFNHFYDLYNFQEKDKDYKSFHFTTYDNPYIPVEELERERISKPENAFAQEYLADFRKREGLVYKDFERSRHVFSDKPAVREIQKILGVDFGWTNPTSILTIIVDYDNTYWVVEEIYKTQLDIDQIIGYCGRAQSNAVYADPAEPDRIEKMKRAGLNIMEVSKDIEHGIECVEKLFKSNKIKIHSSCVNLINELETYAYPEKKPFHNEPELPIKENDHACDALRYALYNTAPVQDDSAMIRKVSQNRHRNMSMK